MGIGPEEFYQSAMTLECASMTIAGFFDWFAERHKAHCFKLEQIPFSKLGQFVGIDVPDDFEFHLNKSDR